MDECNEVKVKVKVKTEVMVSSRSYEGHLLGAPSCLVVGVVQGSYPGLGLPAEPHRLYLQQENRAAYCMAAYTKCLTRRPSGLLRSLLHKTSTNGTALLCRLDFKITRTKISFRREIKDLFVYEV